MSKEKILTAFQKICQSVSRDNTNRYLKNHFPDEYSELMLLTAELDKFIVPGNKNKNVSVFERVYCVEHEMTDRPKCKHCRKEYVCGFDKQKNEYRKWCSAKCQASDPDCIAESKSTRLEKYGSETYHGVEKARRTREAKNGGEWHSADFGGKIRASKLERFGSANFVNPDKAKKTKLEKYGDEHWNNIAAAKAAKLERYGDENWNNREKFKQTVSEFPEEKKNDIKKSRARTCVDKYGVAYPTQNAEVRKKTETTCVEKYGVACSFNIGGVHEKSIQRTKEKSWNRIVSDKDYSPMFSKEEYLSNRDPDRIWLWKCSKCGNEFKSAYDDGRHHRCYKCYPNNECGCSVMEQELFAFVKSVSGGALNREYENRHLLDNNMEIDIIIPEKKIALEFDGLFWHSDACGKNRNYHADKTLACEKKGFRLIHVFEDEWLMKKRLIKNKIKRILKRTKYKIYARLCEVRSVSAPVKNTFLDKYHIQGRDASAINYGLFYRNRLVAVMTFCKSRFSGRYEYELSRYASLNNFSIIGGAGKLLKAFECAYKPKSLVTYADKRWSVGNMYFKLGFKHTHDSPPNYFYIKNQRRYSRIEFQKHKLAGKLEKFDPDKSEYENMNANGYYRIFDCGNMVFVKEYD